MLNYANKAEFIDKANYAIETNVANRVNDVVENAILQANRLMTLMKLLEVVQPTEPLRPKSL